MHRRISVFRESLDVVRALGQGAPVDYQSAIAGAPQANYDGAIVRPAANVPVLIGGVAPAAIRRAGELADGWIMAPFGTLDDYANGYALARDGAVSRLSSRSSLFAAPAGARRSALERRRNC